MSECTPILALILTDVQSLNGADLKAAPIPEHHNFPLDVASALTGATRKAIRNMLSRYPDRFDPPQYRPVFDPITGLQTKGRYADRILTSNDIAMLRRIYRRTSSRK